MEELSTAPAPGADAPTERRRYDSPVRRRQVAEAGAHPRRRVRPRPRAPRLGLARADVPGRRPTRRRQRTDRLPPLRHRTGAPGRSDAPPRGRSRGVVRRARARRARRRHRPRVLGPRLRLRRCRPRSSRTRRSSPKTSWPRCPAWHRSRAVASDWTDTEHDKAAGLLDVLWSVPSFERLVAQWGLGTGDTTDTITWALDLVVAAIHAGRPPAR